MQKYDEFNYVPQKKITQLPFLEHFTTGIDYSGKTPQMSGFLFSNYQSLNNGNLLLESGEILKQKWQKTTKNGMLKTV